MTPQKVKVQLFDERASGNIVFDIPGKKFSYKGVLERIAVDDSYVPKIHIHEKSNWYLIFVHPWMDRYTLYYGNYMNTEAGAMEFLAGVQQSILSGKPLEEIVGGNFQDAFT